MRKKRIIIIILLLYFYANFVFFSTSIFALLNLLQNDTVPGQAVESVGLEVPAHCRELPALVSAALIAVGDAPRIPGEPTEASAGMLLDHQTVRLDGGHGDRFMDKAVFVAITSLDTVLGHRKHVTEVGDLVAAVHATILVRLVENL